MRNTKLNQRLSAAVRNDRPGKVGGNTTVKVDNGRIEVWYYSTLIVSAKSHAHGGGEITINNGGYCTPSTYDRINAVLNGLGVSKTFRVSPANYGMLYHYRPDGVTVASPLKGATSLLT